MIWRECKWNEFDDKIVSFWIVMSNISQVFDVGLRSFWHVIIKNYISVLILLSLLISADASGVLQMLEFFNTLIMLRYI